MNIHRTFALLLVASLSASLPSRPLNERTDELAWQAWLLIDDGQRPSSLASGGGSSGSAGTRRRITPKSVFITPTFSPETLPACEDGYSSDSNGKCIKMYKLNEAAHLDFLLKEILNTQYTTDDYVYEDDDKTVTGTDQPYQVNIPLYSDTTDDRDPEAEGEEDESDMAIVMMPKKKNVETAATATTTITSTSTMMDAESPPSTITTTTTDETSTITSTSTTDDLLEATRAPEALFFLEPTPAPSATTTGIPFKFPDTAVHHVRFPGETINRTHKRSDITNQSNRNHRNRDRHNELFFFPTEMMITDKPHSALVVRLPRKHKSTYAITKRFDKPDFYRAIKDESFVNIFGSRRRTTSTDHHR